MYYFSLEALNCATTPGYAADFKYSYNVGRMNEPQAIAAVNAKIALLDQVAVKFGLSSSFSSMRKLVKGKWLLSKFCDELHQELLNFSSACGKHNNNVCQYCTVGMNAKCTFRLKQGISNKTIYSLVREITAQPNFDYIRERIIGMSCSPI
jgi:hypothetical protein